MAYLTEQCLSFEPRVVLSVLLDALNDKVVVLRSVDFAPEQQSLEVHFVLEENQRRLDHGTLFRRHQGTAAEIVDAVRQILKVQHCARSKNNNSLAAFRCANVRNLHFA